MTAVRDIQGRRFHHLHEMLSTINKKIRTAMKIIGRLVFRLPTRLKLTLLSGKRHYCPICQSHLRLFLPAGAISRLNARCPICGSLERHRLEWIFFHTRTDLFDGAAKRMLHIAPEPMFESKLKRIPNLEYLTADLHNPHVMIKMDISHIPCPDSLFDVIYCCCVLEHVRNDQMAMHELFRVLNPDGWAMLLVPMTVDATTEDASVTSPAERERLFGGADHFRAYGPDYVHRLKDKGFKVRLFRALEILDATRLRRSGVGQDQVVVFCTKQ